MIVFFPITKNMSYYIIYSNTIVVLDGAKVVIYIYLSEKNSKKMNNYIIRYGDKESTSKCNITKSFCKTLSRV